MSEYQRETGSTVDPDDVTVAELQDELRSRDLPVSGNKDELIARLEEAQVEEAGDPVADLAQAEQVEEGGDAPHEVRRDGSVAQFGSPKEREEALSQETYVRETGVDQGSEQ